MADVSLKRFRALGIDRASLPDNLNEFFGMFSSERQNVIKACGIVRSSPLIGPKVPGHGLIVDVVTSRLEWLVNGDQAWAAMLVTATEFSQSGGESLDKLKALADFKIGDMKFPEAKIGETVQKAEDWLSKKAEEIGAKAGEIAQAHPLAAKVAREAVDYAQKHWPSPPPSATAASSSKKIPLPPPIRPKPVIRKVK